MFALFHFVPYEGSDFLGVFSTLERAQEAALTYHAASQDDEDGWEFIGRLEVYPVALDEGFKVDYGQPALWVYA